MWDLAIAGSYVQQISVSTGQRLYYPTKRQQDKQVEPATTTDLRAHEICTSFVPRDTWEGRYQGREISSYPTTTELQPVVQPVESLYPLRQQQQKPNITKRAQQSL